MMITLALAVVGITLGWMVAKIVMSHREDSTSFREKFPECHHNIGHVEDWETSPRQSER